MTDQMRRVFMTEEAYYLLEEIGDAMIRAKHPSAYVIKALCLSYRYAAGQETAGEKTSLDSAGETHPAPSRLRLVADPGRGARAPQPSPATPRAFHCDPDESAGFSEKV